MTGSAAEVILALRLKGVRIWSDDGRLRYKASKGAVTPDDIRKLTALKDEILAIVQQSSRAPAELRLGARAVTEKVPLTFTQQSWWNLMGLEKRHSTRSVFTAMQLLGRLDIPALGQSFSQLVRRHETLRTRIVTIDGIRQQYVCDDPHDALELVEPSCTLEGESEAQAEILTLELVTEAIDVSAGPLFAARLIRLRDDDHVLAVAMDHLISDAASMGILLQEVWTLYGQSRQGLSFCLPKLPVQFADYAVWQQKSHSSWIEKHAAWWADHLAGARHVRLFSDDEITKTARPEPASLPIRFGKTLSMGLRDLARRERTTLAMTILCAYGALAFCWSNTTDLVVPFVTMGRTHVELERVIGFFGCQLFLRVQLHENDSFLDLLRRISKEYAAACEHYDSGKIGAQLPRPEFTRNVNFNWYPAEFRVHPAAFTAFVEDSAATGLGEQLRLQPFMVDKPFHAALGNDVEWDSEGGLLLTDSEDGISGAIAYRTDRAAPVSVSRFGCNLTLFADKLLKEPHGRVKACQLRD
jgi:Condensation domain/TubC N-terminal docking domain